RIGGQLQYDESIESGNTEIYGQTVKIMQPEIWGKYGYNYDDNHSIVFMASTYHQDQNSSFGTLDYDAQQTNVYGNAQYEYNYSTHGLKTGLSLRYLNINEDVGFTSEILNRTYDGNYNRTEVIPGAFAENTMNFFNDKLTWIAGLRVDRHNIHGTFVTPRTLLRYNISPQTVLRTNIGTGWRTANVFSENINLLVSSRDVIFEEELQPEEAVNYGLNLTQKFNARNVSGYISADYYKTNFQNQIFPDYDADPSLAIIGNYSDKSVGNGFQIEAMARFHELVEVKVGYNYLDVYRKTNEVKELLPFNSKHRLMSTLSYKPLSNKFHFDMNIHWYGKQRLPNTRSNPEVYQRPGFSRTYAVMNSQFTYNLKNIEVYFGCENMFDFRQERPIISWQDPFSPYFDTASVWGPTKGREFYIGFKYHIREK
ncbi:MAG: outer membrane receptor for ferrienterochelin and colicins, partial [Saprospiraceae bacterium]